MRVPRLGLSAAAEVEFDGIGQATHQIVTTIMYDRCRGLPIGATGHRAAEGERGVAGRRAPRHQRLRCTLSTLEALVTRRSRSLVLVSALAALACSSGPTALGITAPTGVAAAECAAVDQGDLNAVAGCYAGVGKFWDPLGKWTLMSKTTQAQTTEAQWTAMSKDENPFEYTAFSVLGEENRAGSRFARVSLTLRATSGSTSCSSTKTTTWVQEEGKWRRLYLPTTAEVAHKKAHDGDYDAAIAAADEWLALDPFSMDAYNGLRDASARGGGGKGAHKGDDILRAMLSINPNDSTALFSAATNATDLTIAYAFLSKMARDDCVRNSAVFNVALQVKQAATRIKLLDEEQRGEDPALMCLRVVSLDELHDRQGVLAYLTAPRADAIQEAFDANDPGFAAFWSVRLGTALLNAGDAVGAKRWADYAMIRDPSNRGVARLLKGIGRGR